MDLDYTLDLGLYRSLYSNSEIQHAILTSVDAMRNNLPIKTGNLRKSLRWAYADGMVELWLDKSYYDENDFYPAHLEVGEKSDKERYFWETGISVFQKNLYSTLGGL